MENTATKEGTNCLLNNYFIISKMYFVMLGKYLGELRSRAKNHFTEGNKPISDVTVLKYSVKTNSKECTCHSCKLLEVSVTGV